MRRCLCLLALSFAACSYDLGGFEFAEEDAGARADAGDAGDAGSGRVCEPIAQSGCGPMLTCSIAAWSDALDVRCTMIGAGGRGATCTGASNCAPSLACVGETRGAGTCEAFCGGVRTCPDGLACDRADPLFTLDGTTFHRCR